MKACANSDCLAFGMDRECWIMRFYIDFTWKVNFIQESKNVFNRVIYGCFSDIMAEKPCSPDRQDTHIL